MPRPKAFDVEEALDQAMRLFWERGYEATAMSDIVERLGVSRQSLYDTFGDKRAIYLAALERFRDRLAGPLFATLASEEPIRAVLRKIFEAVIDAEVSGSCPQGCMMLHAAIEQSGADPEVRRLVADNAQRVEQAYTRRLRKAQERGEIGSHHDPVALGRFFASALAGLRVAARTNPDRRALEDVMRVSLAVLG